MKLFIFHGYTKNDANKNQQPTNIAKVERICTDFYIYLSTSCPYIRLGLGITQVNFASALDFDYICIIEKN